MHHDSTTRLCLTCGAPFHFAPWMAAKGGGKFCSHDCYAQSIGPRYTLAERFWRKVQQTPTCWLWTAFRDPNGYGRLMVKRRDGRKGYVPMLAHRIAWELTHGPIPDGLHACHHCDTPACVRPTHLFLGDAAVNMADCAQKGRTTRGARAASVKLTEAQAIEIRQRYAAGGVSQAALAREFGVCQTTISELIRRLTWHHLDP